jgi:hypothetical protein
LRPSAIAQDCCLAPAQAAHTSKSACPVPRARAAQ